MLYQFDEFELDTERFELRRGGKPAHVEPLVFDLLCFLSQNPGRVLGRDEIVDHVWHGRIVSDATIAGCVKAARKALGDSGERQTYIRTVRGRGFQFAGQVDCVDGSGARPSETPPASAEVGADTAADALPPSLAILPFAVIGGEDADLSAIADGLAASLTSVLIRVPLLALASRTATTGLVSQPMPAPEIRRQLGVAYLLEGSVQAIGDTIQANVQLIETRHGFHLWAQQFEVPRDGDAQPALLRAILGRLEPQLVRAIYNDQSGPDGALTGRQLLIKSVGILSLQGWHAASFAETTRLLARAVELEPDLALAHAHLALTMALGQRVGIDWGSKNVVEEAEWHADRALDLDNMDSNVLGVAGCSLADIGQPLRAIPVLKKAIEVNPNNGQGWSALGSAYLIVGKYDEAVHHLQRGVDVSPLDSRLAIWNALLALAYLLAGDPERAEAAALDGCQSNDRIYLPRVVLAAIHLAGGNHAAATRELQESYRIKPDLSQNQMNRLVGKDLGAALAALGVG